MFDIDTNAYTTVNVSQSVLTKIDSWCPRSKPAYSAISTS